MSSKKRVLLAIIILLGIIISLGFVDLKQSKHENDMRILTSKTWLPVKHKGCKINFKPDHTYSMVVSVEPGVKVKGDSTIVGKWSVGENNEINVDCYGVVEAVNLVKINDNNLTIEIIGENKSFMTYTASVYTEPDKNLNLTAKVGDLLFN